MTINSLFILISGPLVYNIPKALAVFLLFFLAFPLIIDFLKKKFKKFKLLDSLILIFIILLGLYLRLSLAFFFRGNFDTWSWDYESNLVVKGKNIYAATSLYRYFPPWIIILGILKKLSVFISPLPFYFIVKAFLSLVDLGSLFVLLLLCRLNKTSFLKAAATFFLNPVSVILTGFHGQFENFAIFFILLGIYFYQKNKKTFFPWLIFTFSGIIKHMFFNQVLLFLNNIFKDKKKIVKFFFFSNLIALVTLLPYLKRGKWSVFQCLILSVYSKTSYGFIFLLNQLHLFFLQELYKYLFIALFFIFPFLVKKKKLYQSCLLGVLFFVCFTPGISDQFFILPIALGVLSQSFWFYLYSLFASLYLFGSSAQFNIEFFKIFSDNLIFIISFFWFFAEYFKNNGTKS